MHNQYAQKGGSIKRVAQDGCTDLFEFAGVLFDRVSGHIYAHGNRRDVLNTAVRMRRTLTLAGGVATLHRMQVVVNRISSDEINRMVQVPGYVLSWYAREQIMAAAGRGILRFEDGSYSHAGFDVRSPGYSAAADHLCMVIITETMIYHNLSTLGWRIKDFRDRLRSISKAHGRDPLDAQSGRAQCDDKTSIEELELLEAIPV
ncbi:hypothetical protein [Devosia sp.]|uniref:hypothetical protein n=1 Tax=Devosia sp. TaxID=1871048 RepID=UPI0027326366|nr:hypothetical protein [Devosia sp.]MDP2782266.1 hypothetical protein [Devosia sp.]